MTELLDPFEAVRRGYYTLLSGNLSKPGGGTVPVYDETAPMDAAAPYVLLGGQTDAAEYLKGCGYRRTTMTIRVVTAFEASKAGGRKQADAIAMQLLMLVTGETSHPEGWRRIDRRLAMNMSVPAYTDGARQIRERVVRFEDDIEPLPPSTGSY